MLVVYYKHVPSIVNKLENKITSAEQKPNISNLATIQNVTTVLNKVPDVKDFVKKTDYDTEINGIKNSYTKKTDFSTEISNIKNNYATKAILDSKINDLKDTHIADDIKKIDEKVKKNITDILKNKSSVVHHKSVIDDLERGAQSFYGDQYYNNAWLIFKGYYHSFYFVSSKYINYWKSKEIFRQTLDRVANSRS